MRKRLINRRQFLTKTGTTLALGAMSGVLSPSVARVAVRAQDTTGEVLVIGAGLAGLAAAYELDKAGFGVTILETRGRSGGRVHFAGEHTETSSMDGAIKSGVRVAEEIKKAA